MPDTLPQRRMLPTLLLLVAAASWGGNWVAARAVYQKTDYPGQCS